MEDLEYLDDQDVDRLDDAVTRISGDQSGYTGLAGETRTARRVIENNDNADVEMDATVDPDNIADEDLPDGVTKDDLKDGPTDIDVNNRNGAAYESKNTYFDSDEYRDSFNSDDIADVALGGDVNSLRKKLNTIAASGQDEIVVVVRNKDVTFDSDVRESFPSDVQDVESLTGLADRIESQFDGTEVTIKSFDQVES